MMSEAVAPALSSWISNCTPPAYLAVTGMSCSLSAAVWYVCNQQESLGQEAAEIEGKTTAFGVNLMRSQV